jgi:hypothetical protein
MILDHLSSVLLLVGFGCVLSESNSPSVPGCNSCAYERLLVTQRVKKIVPKARRRNAINNSVIICMLNSVLSTFLDCNYSPMLVKDVVEL